MLRFVNMRRFRVALLAGLVALAATPARAQGPFAQLDAAIREGIRIGAYPGAVIVVGRSDSVLYSKGYGRLTWSTKAKVPDPAKTLWDLASLSKVVATTSAAAVLVDEGKLDLDAPLSRYLPEFTGDGKQTVTMRMLLNHTSGMPPYASLWRGASSPTQAWARLFNVPLAREAGISPLYSDLNAMLAGLVVERVSGVALDVFARSAVFSPMGMAATTYRLPAKLRGLAAPTAKWGGQPVAGVVNDPNARALGGVSGHAGVFSTGADLARFAQSWLRDSTVNAKQWLASSTIGQFFERSTNSGARALGWDTPEHSDTAVSIYGRCATSATVGHTGWTGTELWLDPSQNMFVVFLTNRSYAPRKPKLSLEQMKEIRAKVSDAARSGMGLCLLP